ncbi:hypothetical protein JXB12_06325 [candidate division KSB1 bacterium]|nr:hypothetical protein [candidate division KSB1 bacterium]
MDRLVCCKRIVIMLTMTLCWMSVADFAKSEPQPLLRYQRINVLFLVLNNGGASAIDSPTLRRSAEIVRLFAWRHSGCKLDFKPILIDVKPDLVAKEFLSHSENESEFLKDLLAYHLKSKSQDCNLVIYVVPGGYLERNRMLSYFNGQRLIAVIPIDYPSPVFYPTHDPQLYHHLIWPILNVYIQAARHAYMPDSAEKNPGIKIQEFKSAADLFRLVRSIDVSEDPYGETVEAVDQDHDGIPDDDPTVMLDEIRFGSSAKLIDSDQDALSDFDELVTLLYRATDPKNIDTDRDGISDGQDRYPHIPVQPEIPKFTPSFDDPIDRWYIVSRELQYTFYKSDLEREIESQLYMSWDDEFLYIASATNIPCYLEFFIDSNHDGWEVGCDNYYLVIDPFSSRFEELKVLDNTSRALNLPGQTMAMVWDNETDYISQYGRLIDESEVRLATKIRSDSGEDRFIVKFALPANEQTGLLLREGKQIGIKAYYNLKLFDRVKLIGSLYEPDSFFTIELR